MIETGIHYSVPMADYIADPCKEPSLSTRMVHLLIERTAVHAYRDHVRLGGRKRAHSRKADFGSASHNSWLGGLEHEQVMIPYREKGKKAAPDAELVPAESYVTKDAQWERDRIVAAGKVPLVLSEVRRLDGMMAELSAYRGHMGIDGKPEATIVWQEDGVWFRARPDLLIDRPLLNLNLERPSVWEYKTCVNAETLGWIKRSAIPGGYDVKAALIVRGLKAVTGVDWDFVFLVQEDEEPYACNAIGAAREFIQAGNRKIERARAIWRRCLETDEWPRYGYGIKWAELPNYARYEDDARELLQEGV